MMGKECFKDEEPAITVNVCVEFKGAEIQMLNDVADQLVECYGIPKQEALTQIAAHRIYRRIKDTYCKGVNDR